MTGRRARSSRRTPGRLPGAANRLYFILFFQKFRRAETVPELNSRVTGTRTNFSPVKYVIALVSIFSVWVYLCENARIRVCVCMCAWRGYSVVRARLHDPFLRRITFREKRTVHGITFTAGEGFSSLSTTTRRDAVSNWLIWRMWFRDDFVANTLWRSSIRKFW